MFLTSKGKYNIWRIGPVQSQLSNVGEVGVIIVVGDAGLREADGLEVPDSGGFSEHHRFGVSRTTAPTMLSPSSFPQTSDKMSEGEKKG